MIGFLLALISSSAFALGPLPDGKLTPGAFNSDVTQATIQKTICVPGYTATIRNVPSAEKRAVFARYGIKNVPGKFEVDHLASLEIGGSNAIENLWPEPYEPRPGAHEKDQVENRLHKLICAGKIQLKDAQKIITQDWLSYWKANLK